MTKNIRTKQLQPQNPVTCGNFGINSVLESFDDHIRWQVPEVNI